jgi:hypothetical protein
MALPAIIVPRDSIGSRLGAGIGHGLEQLAHNKMQQLAQQNQQKQNRDLINNAFPDAPEGVRAFIAAQDPKDLFKTIQAFGQSGLLEGNKGQGSQSSPLQESMQSLNQQEQQQPQMNTKQLLDMLGVHLPGDLSQFVGQAPQMNQPQQSAVQPHQQQNVLQEAQQPQTIAQDKNPSIGQAIANYKSPQLQLQERMFEEKLKSQAFANTKEFRKEILDSGKSGQEELRRITDMRRLNQKGELTDPVTYKLLSMFGLDIGTILGTDDEAYKKMEAEFLSNARSWFGGRISNYEVQSFMRSIPTLLNSQEGRERILNNLEFMARAKTMRADEMIDILKENKDVPPNDLMEQVYQRAGKKFDQLADKFREGLEESPKKKSKSVSSLYSRPMTVSESLPDPSTIKNKKTARVRDKVTGQLLKLNDDFTDWVPTA